MKHCGLEIEIKNRPELDIGFIPMQKFNETFLRTAKLPFAFAIERNDEQIAVVSTFVHGDEEYREADCYYLERLVKFQLWQKGGFRIYVKGDASLGEYLRLT